MRQLSKDETKKVSGGLFCLLGGLLRIFSFSSCGTSYKRRC